MAAMVIFCQSCGIATDRLLLKVGSVQSISGAITGGADREQLGDKFQKL